MTATAWDLPPVVTRDQLGALAAPVSSGDGQSLSVSPLAGRPAFLFKEYRTPGGPGESARLDRLIRQPETVPDVAPVLRARTSWPVARVEGTGGGSLGCVIPRAPELFLTDVAPAGRRPGGRRYLEVDLLAAAPERLTLLGVPVPSPDQRMAAARSVVEIAAGLERLGLVYSDWSYSNAFWSPRAGAVFVIDIDGCAAGSTPNIYQPNWEDPLTPRESAADTYVERYRVALLVARCLTGRRAVPAVVARLRDTRSPVCGPALREALLDMMLMRDRERRPAISALDNVLHGAPHVRFPGARIDIVVPAPPRPPAPPSVVTPPPPVPGSGSFPPDWAKTLWQSANPAQVIFWVVAVAVLVGAVVIGIVDAQ